MSVISHVPTATLVALHNSVAEMPVKRFASRSAAELRLGRLMAERGLHLVEEGEDFRLEPAGEAPATNGATEPAPASQAADEHKPEGKAEPKGRKTAQRARKAPAADDRPDGAAVIRVVEKPKARLGSKRAARFAKIKDGITVAAYVEAAHRATGRSPARCRADVARLVSKGSLRLEG